MLAKQALQLLGVSRPTLSKYAKNGTIARTVMPNGRYEYNDEDIAKLLAVKNKRKTVIYVRTDSVQKSGESITKLRQLCESKNLAVSEVLADVSSDMSSKIKFFWLVDEVMAGHVENVIMLDMPDVEIEVLQYIFSKFKCSIITPGEKMQSNAEIMNELSGVLRHYANLLGNKPTKRITVDGLIKEHNEKALVRARA